MIYSDKKYQTELTYSIQIVFSEFRYSNLCFLLKHKFLSIAIATFVIFNEEKAIERTQ